MLFRCKLIAFLQSNEWKLVKKGKHCSKMNNYILQVCNQWEWGSIVGCAYRSMIYYRWLEIAVGDVIMECIEEEE